MLFSMQSYAWNLNLRVNMFLYEYYEWMQEVRDTLETSQRMPDNFSYTQSSDLMIYLRLTLWLIMSHHSTEAHLWKRFTFWGDFYSRHARCRSSSFKHPRHFRPQRAKVCMDFHYSHLQASRSRPRLFLTNSLTRLFSSTYKVTCLLLLLRITRFFELNGLIVTLQRNATVTYSSSRVSSKHTLSTMLGITLNTLSFGDMND